LRLGILLAEHAYVELCALLAVSCSSSPKVRKNPYVISSKPANGLAEDVIVLPCRSVHMQGAD
jgi:uncharacterized protein YcfL